MSGLILPSSFGACFAQAVATNDYAGTRVLLIHPTGADGSQTITDVFGHGVTAMGNAQIDDAVVPFAGARSIQCDGDGDYLDVADSPGWNISASDQVTVDVWIHPTAHEGPNEDVCVMAMGADSATGLYLLLTITAFQTWQMWVYANGAWRITGGVTVPINAWTFVRFVKDASSHKLYLNGSQNGNEWQNAAAWTPDTLRFGAIAAAEGTYNKHFTGRMAEMRITKGAALSGAVVPTSTFNDT